MINNLFVLHQSKLEKMGRKNALEEFLKEQENALELKKEKLKKKRSKRKEKKKNKKGKNTENEIIVSTSINSLINNPTKNKETESNNSFSEKNCFCDENSLENVEISETEIKLFQEKWKEIKDMRENLRKKLEKNFHNYLKKTAKEN
jgi:hypothetical protein